MYRKSSSASFIVCLVLLVGVGNADGKPLPELDTIVISDAIVHTMTGKTVRGSVVVERGKITCIGACPIPPKAHKIEAKAAVVVPGLVESNTHAGLEEVSLEPASGDGTISAVENVAHVRAVDGITVGSRVVDACRRGGLTTLVANPLGRALLSGQSAAFAPTGVTVDDFLVKAPVAVHAHVGGHAMVPKGGVVLARSGQVAALRTALGHAAAVAAGGKNAALAKLRLQPEIMALVGVIKRDIPLVVHANRADAMAAVVRLANSLKIRLVLTGGAEAHLIAQRLAAAKVPVILSPVIASPYGFDSLRARDDSAALLHRAGVVIGLSTGSSHNARNLRWAAGWAVASGLSADVALRAITDTPARILGLPAHIGRIAVGDPARLAVFDGNPLSIRSHVIAVVIGKQVDMRPQQR